MSSHRTTRNIQRPRSRQYRPLRLRQSRCSDVGHPDRQLRTVTAGRGGPNFFEFGDNVLYEILIDNNGDSIADIAYQFQFTTTVKNPNTFVQHRPD